MRKSLASMATLDTSVMLTSFPDSCGARLKIACHCGQVKTASLYPSANLKIICVQQQIIHFTSQPLIVSFLQCMYNMHNTRPHLCMQPCKQGEWGEQVHLTRESPLGFE